MYLNKTFVLGNLTRDPELKSLPSGNQVANFSVATNRVWKDREGNKQEGAEFHNIVCFGRTAELCAQYLRKGSQVLVEGRLQTRSWEQEGQKKYRTEIVADNVQFGSRPQGGEGSGYAPRAGASNTSANAQSAPARSADKEEAIAYPDENINPEDIPF